MRATSKLTHKQLVADIAKLRAAKRPGEFGDGGGLYLVVTPAGYARFVHKFQWQGKTRERMIPGDFPEVLLGEAREIRDADRKLLRAGINPIQAAKALAVAAQGVPTFAEYAKAHVDFLAPANANGRAAWLRQMTGEDTEGETVGALAAMPIDNIEREHVKAVIAPLWLANPPTAKELLGRIRRTLDHRYVNTNQDDRRVNPAGFNLMERAIGKKYEHQTTSRAALPWEEVPLFLAKLAGRASMSARALEMIIATGCRAKEITHARWDEISWKARTLTIPAARMKTEHDTKGQPHVIPLSLAMVRILRAVMPPKGYKPDDLIFANGVGRPYATKDVLVHVKALAGPAPTTHGFRSALTDWGSAGPHRARGVFAETLMDKVIAHKVGDDVRRAYQRDTWLDRRRVVMREWSRFCGAPPSAVVLPFRRAA